MKKRPGPRVLLFDIETSPILAWIWSLRDEHIAPQQIKEDWYVMSWAAKWHGEKKIYQEDKRNQRSDKQILKSLGKLLDKADVVITQNGKRFDVPKLKARMIMHGLRPFSSFMHYDTWQVAKKIGFSSTKLEYLAKHLSPVRKMTNRKFNGFELWLQCMAGNKAAWKEMAEYNKVDVEALEYVYNSLVPWDQQGIDHSIFFATEGHVCSCGSMNTRKYGFAYKGGAKYQRFTCVNCGAMTRSRENLLSKEKRKSLRARGE